uniref:Uncharacterized protein n=1 Tax=Arundo donax TaxID=35708 RepID=A0A0A8ZG48_ARUDO
MRQIQRMTMESKHRRRGLGTSCC